MSSRSADIDRMIAVTTDWRGATLAALRTVVHEADPDIVEVVKWKRPGNPLGAAVFEHDGIVCMGVLLKNSVRLVLAEGARLPDPGKLFNAQLAGNRSRAIDFAEGDPLRKTALKALIRAGVKHSVAKAKSARKTK